MVQQLLLRRFLTSVISGKPSQSVGSPYLQGTGDPNSSPSNLTGTPSHSWLMDTTSVCTNSNIQDGPDFQDRAVSRETPVVVDFHAQWCGPCEIWGPRLEKVVTKQQGKEVMT